MSSNLSPLEMLTALIENERDYLEPEELAQKIIDAGFISIHHSIPAQIAYFLANEMQDVIRMGDVAESAAYVPGETGRGAAIDRRDALHEEPHEWLKTYARKMGLSQ